MPDQDRRREQRHPCTLTIGVFLSEGRNGPAVSAVFQGELTGISRHGAGVALAEIMAGRTHLAYGPMESATLQLNILLPAQGEESPLNLPVRPVWLNKVPGEDLPPFRLGLEFMAPLAPSLLRSLDAQCRKKTVARTTYDAVINRNIK